MTEAEIMDFTREAIVLTIKISAPVMLVGLVTGLIIALIQALTQIQEMTLVFVPKIIAIFIALIVALPFMGDVLHGYMGRIASRIITG